MNETLKVGQLLFYHTEGTFSKFIRAGEWVKFREGHDVNHVAVVDRFENGHWYVIQAEPHGITNDKTVEEVVGALGGWYKQIALPATCDVNRGLEWLRMQVGEEYGFFDITAIAFNLYTPGWISIHEGNTWICSALAMEYARVCGWLHNWPNIYDVIPSQAWEEVFSM